MLSHLGLPSGRDKLKKLFSSSLVKGLSAEEFRGTNIEYVDAVAAISSVIHHDNCRHLLTWRRWMVCMALNSKVSKTMSPNGVTLPQYYEEHVCQSSSSDGHTMSYKQFDRYNREGSHLARIARSGGLHTLLLILAFGLVAELRKMNGFELDIIAAGLTDPSTLSDANSNEKEMKQLLLWNVLPGLAWLRSFVPLRAFSRDFGVDLASDADWFDVHFRQDARSNGAEGSMGTQVA
ncbi:hypothetical protein DACRYDRAFT_23060 [Dacryopinax primogenitus]|uniref:Uncharacterized protein n=1 Tax=Dacryopinax primogenitus (strain DJM 731) TaxID=1858805 RepID=M5G4D2_DACPD|nr:uncharacterized protein DACRYDRAFT_23060 [Dacryopinax primogenitus]EJU00677.1 hypothetical protein DACRYDRAFT_23060 [Dacryopinax primogenitus]